MRHADHAFLQRGHCRVAHLNRQVTPRHHDAVAGAQNFFQLRNGLSPLDFGNQVRLVPERSGRHIAQLTRHFHVGGVLGKAHRHIVGPKAHGGFDVFHVFGGERGGGQAAALFVDALVVRQLAPLGHGAMHRRTFDGLHLHDDHAVVEHQHVASLYILRQLFVVKSHTLCVAQFGTRRIQHKGLAGNKHDLVVRKFTDANFGALQVGHDRHLATGALGRIAHELRPIYMVLRLAVAEVQAHHVDASTDHLLEQGRFAGGGPQRGHDFGGAVGHVGSQ